MKRLMKLFLSENQPQRCTAEIQRMLPELANRHSALVLVAALTEHLGGALFLTQEAQVCSASKAQEIIQRVKDIAFAGAEAQHAGGVSGVPRE